MDKKREDNIINTIIKDIFESYAGKIFFFPACWVLVPNETRECGQYKSEKGWTRISLDSYGRKMILKTLRAVRCHRLEDYGMTYATHDDMTCSVPASTCKKCKFFKKAERGSAYKFPRCSDRGKDALTSAIASIEEIMKVSNETKKTIES